jgi:hypothetical protein
VTYCSEANRGAKILTTIDRADHTAAGATGSRENIE